MSGPWGRRERQNKRDYFGVRHLHYVTYLGRLSRLNYFRVTKEIRNFGRTIVHVWNSLPDIYSISVPFKTERGIDVGENVVVTHLGFIWDFIISTSIIDDPWEGVSWSVDVLGRLQRVDLGKDRPLLRLKD